MSLKKLEEGEGYFLGASLISRSRKFHSTPASFLVSFTLLVFQTWRTNVQSFRSFESYLRMLQNISDPEPFKQTKKHMKYTCTKSSIFMPVCVAHLYTNRHTQTPFISIKKARSIHRKIVGSGFLGFLFVRHRVPDSTAGAGIRCHASHLQHAPCQRQR